MTGSRFKPYPETKDSGIEWLGQIPAHWEARRLKCLATINDEALGEDTDPDYEISYIDIGNVDATKGILEKESYRFEDAPSRARRVVHHGDVIVSTVRTYLRAIAPIVDREPNLIVSTGFAVIRPWWSLCSGFASYMLRAPYLVDRVVAESVGVSYPAISAWQLGTFRVAVPGKDEQQAIADFLDQETAKIDALVEKKERLIELLQEKRTALITHAVTKGLPAAAAAQAGLDPSVPMKDSGIEWLGQIPAHWEIRPLKSDFVFRKGRNAQELTVSYIKDHPGEFPVYSGQTEDSGLMGTIDSYEYDFPEVILTTTVGARVMTPMIVRGRFSLSQNCLVMIPEEPLAIPRFFFYQLYPCFEYERASIPDYMQPSLRVSDLLQYRMAVPPTSERMEVADFLDRETAKLDALIAKVSEAIERLKEYRIALISAAVTGKIDVRNE